MFWLEKITPCDVHLPSTRKCLPGGDEVGEMGWGSRRCGRLVACHVLRNEGQGVGNLSYLYVRWLPPHDGQQQ